MICSVEINVVVGEAVVGTAVVSVVEAGGAKPDSVAVHLLAMWEQANGTYYGLP